MTFLCPKCGSDTWKSVRLIHEQGSLFTHKVGGEVGLEGGTSGVGVKVGIGKSIETSYSKLVENCRPPASSLSVIDCLFLLVLIGGCIFSLTNKIGDVNRSFGVAVFVGCAICVVFFVLKVAKRIFSNHDSAMRLWNKKQMCLKCGAIFVLPDRQEITGT